MTQLNLHGDNLVALEAIKKADLAFRTRPSSRDPLQPTANHFSPNIAASSRPSFNQSSLLSSGDENLSPFTDPSAEDDKSRVQHHVADSHITRERGTSWHLPTNNHPGGPPQPKTFQELREQCGFQDYVNSAVPINPGQVQGIKGKLVSHWVMRIYG